MNPPQLVRMRCADCNFETFRCESGVGSFILTCTNCSAKYVLGIAFGKIEFPKDTTNVKQ